METCERWWGYKHIWDKWNIDKETNVLESYPWETEKRTVGKAIYQRRMCLKCGLVEIKRSEVTN